MIAAEEAVRAWVNTYPGLAGAGNPLAMGAFLRSQRSPASGAYAVLTSLPAQGAAAVAEDGAVSTVRVGALVYAGTVEAAEAAAAAYTSAVESLTGKPAPMGDSGVVCLVSDNVEGPAYIEQPADSGEEHCFSVNADFVLYQEG